MANTNTISFILIKIKSKLLNSLVMHMDALEVSACLRAGYFKRLYDEMQIHNIQNELDEMDDKE